MKIRILTIAALIAILGTTANAAPFPPFGDPQGYMNVFDLGLFGGKDAFNYESPWAVADLTAITSNNITFELIPNTNQYANAVASGDTNEIAFWTDSPDEGTTPGTDGNKWMEANCYYVATIPVNTTNCKFTVVVNANDLDARYNVFSQEPRAFIKVLDSVGGSWATIGSDFEVLDTPGTYTCSLNIDDPAWYGQEIQAGFVLEGRNANPADDWGSISVTASNLVMSSSDPGAPSPNPTFADGPKPVGDNSITMTSTTANDISGVEYLFENVDLGYDSGWQSDTNWTDLGPIGPPTTGDVEFISAPNYVPLDGVWEGYWDGGNNDPSLAVSVSAGVATVTPSSASEFNFYQSFGAGPAGNAALTLGQAYEFSIVSDNSTLDAGTTDAVAFVKAFNSGWGFLAGEFKTEALPMDGSTTTISFTPVAGAYYQVGTYTVGTTSGSYEVSNPSLLGLDFVSPGTPVGLTPDTTYGYRVKARDLSASMFETPWSSVSNATTLAGDTNAPTPNPMTFEASEASPQSVKLVATEADDDSAVEYYFESVAGDGVDSGWQSSRIYIDTGLASSSNFTYRVRARDTSSATNTTDWSTNIVVTTLPYPGSFALANSLQGFTGNSNLDATVHEILKAKLEFAEYADLNRRVGFDASGATFGGFLSGDNGRNVLRTQGNEYANTSFEAYITVTGWTGDENIFIGLGPGDIGSFGVPDWSQFGETTNASFICEMTGSGAGIWSQEANTVSNFTQDASTSFTLATGTVQRIRLTFDFAAQEGTLEIDTTYNGTTFSPDASVGPLSVPDFSTSESKIYLGGDDGIILSNFAIVGAAAPIVPPENLAIQILSGGNKLLTWTTVLGQTYDVEYKTALTAGSWTPEVSDIAGTGGSVSATSTVSAAEAFYQISTE